MSAGRIHSYRWTLNNYTDDEIRLIQSGDYKYIIYGKEVGEECGTPHLQGFVSFESAKTMSAAHKLPGWKRTAMLVADYPTVAIAYCRKGTQPKAEWLLLHEKGPTYGKSADVWERGSYGQGRRTELDEVYNQIRGGASVNDIAWENPDIYERAHKSMSKLEDIRLRNTRRKEMTQGIWVFGETGTGKSEFAFSKYDDGNAYAYPYDNGWWDGYKGQDIVIIDEFRGQIPYNEILRMVDKHPNYYVRRRNREPMPFVSKQVIVTSALHPKEVFKNLSANDSMEQIYRRFKIYKLTKGASEPEEIFGDGDDYASS